MRAVLGIAALIGVVACLLAATLYVLRRLRVTAARLAVAVFAGVLTNVLLWIVVRVADLSAASWASFAASAYWDLFGVRTVAVRLFYPEFYFPSPDSVLPDHPRAEMIADWLPIFFWIGVFTVLYLLLVRRAPQTI